MTRKKRQTGAKKPVRTRDGYNNFAAKLGGYTSNIQSGGSYQPGYISRKRVTEHWAFGAHAQAISEEDLKQSQGGEDLSLKISALESTIAGLQQQVTDKDVTIAEQSDTIAGLQQQLDELTEKLASQEAGNAKKQPSANK